MKNYENPLVYRICNLQEQYEGDTVYYRKTYDHLYEKNREVQSFGVLLLSEARPDCVNFEEVRCKETIWINYFDIFGQYFHRSDFQYTLSAFEVRSIFYDSTFDGEANRYLNNGKKYQRLTFQQFREVLEHIVTIEMHQTLLAQHYEWL